MYPTFNPPLPPDHEMTVTVKEEILESNFGEFTQRAKMGLNAQKADISPSWTNLYKHEADAIISFLKARGRTEPFYYTPPEEPQAIYVCDSLSYKWKRGRRCDISAQFIETRVP